MRLVEPFAGGGVVALTSVMEGLVGSATMIERDESVAAVWKAILGRSGRRLVKQIKHFEFTEKNVRDILEREPNSTREAAFQTILKNRVNRNGILASNAGMLKKGEANYGLQSRWYPDTISDRIMNIIEYRDRITVKNVDGLRYLKKCVNRDDLVYFIDPPYCNVGKRLYRYGEINHERLFEIVSSLRGDFLMTYSNTEEILTLADKYGFQTRSIWMYSGRNSAKMELLIGKSLDWISVSVGEAGDAPDTSSNGNGFAGHALKRDSIAERQ